MFSDRKGSWRLCWDESSVQMCSFSTFSVPSLHMVLLQCYSHIGTFLMFSQKSSRGIQRQLAVWRAFPVDISPIDGVSVFLARTLSQDAISKVVRDRKLYTDLGDMGQRSTQRRVLQLYFASCRSHSRCGPRPEKQ
jgi:hypothetical protein